MSGAPVSMRIFPTDSPGLPRTLRGLLLNRRAELMDGLFYASDWADYRQRIGAVQGIDEAIEYCTQIEKDMNG